MKSALPILVVTLVALTGRPMYGIPAKSSSVLSPSLRKIAETPGTTKVPVTVLLSADADLGNLIEKATEQRRAGFRWVRGTVQGKNLAKLTEVPGVAAVLDQGSRTPPTPPDPYLPE